jgi:putative peptidoglycan lipid II flippase
MPAPTSSLLRATALLAGAALLSRVLGYVRDLLLAWHFGAGAWADAYHAAFVLPDMLHYFLAGGALSVTMVPTLRGLQEEGREEHGRRLLWGVVLTTVGLLVPAIALAWWQAPRIVAALYPGFDGEQLERTVALTRIVLPGPLLFAVGGLCNAASLARQHFAAVALAPLVYNAGIIIGGLVGGAQAGPAGFSWGAMVGAALGPFGLSALLARPWMAWAPPMVPWKPEVRSYYWAAIPLLVGVSLTTADEWLGRWALSTHEAGDITRLHNARRLLLLGIALLGQATGLAALPALAALHAAGRRAEFARLLDDVSRQVWAVGWMLALGLATAASSLVPLLYERGAWDHAASAGTAQLLMILALALPPWCAQTVLVRGFHARRAMWTPMAVTSLAVLAVVPLFDAVRRNPAWPLAWVAWISVGGLWLTWVLLAVASRRAGDGRVWAPAWRGQIMGLGVGLPAAGIAWGLARSPLAESGHHLAVLAGQAAVWLPALVLSLRWLSPSLWQKVRRRVGRGRSRAG